MKNKISRIQEQFWLLNNVYKNNSAYNITSIFSIDGELNFMALEKAINSIIRKHEVLKSYYTEENESVIQHIVQNPEYKIIIEDIQTPLNEDIPDQVLSEINSPFNLAIWPLFRIKLFRINQNRHILSIVFHHIIIDLHSKEIFASELSDYYNKYSRGASEISEIETSQYSEYSLWLNSWLKSDEAANKMKSWEEEFSQPIELLELPADFQRKAVVKLEGKRILFEIGNKSIIHELAKSHNLNSYTILLSFYAIFLNLLTRQNRIGIGVPLTNRKNELFKDCFGCFVNIVPIFIEFSADDTIAHIIKKVRFQLLSAHRRQEIPFLDLFSLYRTKNGNGSANMFQAGYAFEPPMKIHFENCQVKPVLAERNGSQLDVFLTLWEDLEKIQGYFEFSSELFSEETMNHFIEIFLKLVDFAASNPETYITNIEAIPESDALLLENWNNTDKPYRSHLCLHQVFEEQVSVSPHAAALLYNDKILTYEELEIEANRVANFLLTKGVRIEDKIGVCLERSLEMLVCIIGIHKAGAVYVPIDPHYPADRMQMILEDALPEFIITSKLSHQNISHGFRKIYVDNLFDEPLCDQTQKPNVSVQSNNLAYIIYTSGSTGKPKGVMIEHHSVINKLDWMQHQHPLNPGDTLMLKTPVTFDVSVWELFWWYFNGARLTILPPQAEKDPKTIIEITEKHQVTLIIFVPSMFSSFAGYLNANELTYKLKSVKWIIQIGEALSPQLVNQFNNLKNSDFSPLMVNTYGPAEATVAVTYYNCPENDVDTVYIGKPIFNTKIFIVNNHNKILPVGVPGELVITGVNVARGYLNRPELNTEKFITIVYNGETLKAYKTGDLAKWNINGNLEFIGRVDNQVKIRGYRIELGDIEAVMLQCPEVNSAAVIVDNSNSDNKFLIGYATLKDKGTGSAELIKNFMQTKLPEYMIPTHLVILDEMPLNRSEKIDRKALPKPVIGNQVNLIPPESIYEIELSKIWKNILKIERIGVTDNFFDVGGNSLLSIQLVSNIKNELKLSVEPIMIMEYPTIRGLAKYFNTLITPDELDSNNNHVILRKQDFSSIRRRRF